VKAPRRQNDGVARRRLLDLHLSLPAACPQCCVSSYLHPPKASAARARLIIFNVTIASDLHRHQLQLPPPRTTLTPPRSNPGQTTPPVNQTHSRGARSASSSRASSDPSSGRTSYRQAISGGAETMMLSTRPPSSPNLTPRS